MNMDDFVGLVQAMDVLVSEETLRQIEIGSFAHLKDNKSRTDIIKKYQSLLPKVNKETVSAKDMARLLSHG